MGRPLPETRLIEDVIDPFFDDERRRVMKGYFDAIRARAPKRKEKKPPYEERLRARLKRK